MRAVTSKDIWFAAFEAELNKLEGDGMDYAAAANLATTRADERIRDAFAARVDAFRDRQKEGF